MEHSAVIGRLAPSPTGRMHIGNAYAALAAWLGVRSRNGRLVLRIEDIDTPRVVPDADRWIMDDLDWLGLNWDGDPVYQSARLDRYQQVLDVLSGMTLNEIIRASVPEDGWRPSASHSVCQIPLPYATAHTAGHLVPDTSPRAESPLIYPCFCSRADIRAASAPNEGDGFIIYPGTCRAMPAAERDARVGRSDRHSWRIAVPEPGSLAGAIAFDDEVFGSQYIDLGRQVGDVVIRRSDGLFAYQLVVSIDDFDMGVTQIVRGRDLLRSTAIQLWIRRALGRVSRLQSQTLTRTPSQRQPRTQQRIQAQRLAQPPSHTAPIPQFAHLPLVDDLSGKRLAKRDRALDLGVLREEGVSPERIIGYCAWMLGLLPRPTPCRPCDLLDGFTWNTVAEHRDDHRCDTRDLLR
ncbi:glutamyl-Q tRNA(Asp) synthetase [Bifidobacterium boum]|uniref:Glutamyl-Q tRNA(Asp) synthetase n=2 Tax=Bifidobacterium boum TaxID=78343 RepID=A0A848D882_9BIFI|nr:glutamyl-Q tRNA(Asp) synthetase [Bifidobacterium boum]